jgi:hypothetical protein
MEESVIQISALGDGDDDAAEGDCKIECLTATARMSTGDRLAEFETSWRRRSLEISIASDIVQGTDILKPGPNYESFGTWDVDKTCKSTSMV